MSTTLSDEGISLIDSHETGGSHSSITLDINDSSQNYVLTYAFYAGANINSSSSPKVALMNSSNQYMVGNWSLHSSGTTSHTTSTSQNTMQLCRLNTGTQDWFTFITVKMGYFQSLNGYGIEDIHLCARTKSQYYTSNNYSTFDILNAYFPVGSGNVSPRYLRFSASNGSHYSHMAGTWGVMGK